MIRLFACLLMGLLSPSWAALPLPVWIPNTWGAVPTVAVAREDTALCGASGYYLALTKSGSGAHELTLPGVLQPGRAYSFSVEFRGLSGKGWLDVFFRRAGAPYETTAIRTVQTSTDWQRVTLRGIYDANTTGSVRLALRDEGMAICLRKPTLIYVNERQVGAREGWHLVPSTFMGVHLNKLGRHNGWPSFHPRVVRMWDTGTTWADLQPKREDTAWVSNEHVSRLDYFWRHVQKAPKPADLLMTLGMTPEWAVAPGEPNCAHAHYGAKACHPPANLMEWRAHVRGLAQRYKGRIRYWEILNEADLGMHWSGSSAQLLAFVAAAADELKIVDPSNVVIGPNVTTMGYRLLSDFIRLGGAHHVDAFSVHGYIGRTPHVVQSKLRNLRELLFGQGLTHPIWNTEAGTSCLTGVDCHTLLTGMTPLDGASALAQAYLGQAVLGVANVSYYTWEGGVIDAGGLPLVKSDFHTETSAGVVLRQLSHWLDGAQVRSEDSGLVGVRRIGLNGEVGKCTVWWAEEGVVQLPAELLTLFRKGVDALGAVVLLDGESSVRLTTLPILFCQEG